MAVVGHEVSGSGSGSPPELLTHGFHGVDRKEAAMADAMVLAPKPVFSSVVDVHDYVDMGHLLSRPTSIPRFFGLTDQAK